MFTTLRNVGCSVMTYSHETMCFSIVTCVCVCVCVCLCVCLCVQFAQAPYRSSSLDLNVMPVWKKNITGNGVVVSIIDDGELNTQMHRKHMHSFIHSSIQRHNRLWTHEGYLLQLTMFRHKGIYITQAKSCVCV